MKRFPLRFPSFLFSPTTSTPPLPVLLFPSLPSSSSPSPTAVSMESPSRSSPIAFPGAFAGAGDDSLVPDPNSGSAAGSLQGAGDGPLAARDEAAEFGFLRPEFGREELAGTVHAYDRHVFLCYKSPEVWPARVEASESDRLLRLLAAALKARKGDMKKRTLLTICEGEDGTDSSNGDVLIFPDMMRYRRLTHFDADNFVEEVLVKDTEWLPGAAETLTGSYVFVCAHGSRDRRCGVCGPALIEKFKEEINIRNLQGQVFVSACSHIGGHKYAGNVIIFSPTVNGEVTGHWYGYVAPDDVAVLLEQHIGKGKIIDRLWRGQMGLPEEDQKQAQNLRLQLNGGLEQTAGSDGVSSGATNGAAGCCQGISNSTCCQTMHVKDETEDNHTEKQETREVEQKTIKESKVTSSKGAHGSRRICAMPTWFESWEREDTYAALAVVAAVASVAVAYSYYRQMK